MFNSIHKKKNVVCVFWEHSEMLRIFCETKRIFYWIDCIYCILSSVGFLLHYMIIKNKQILYGNPLSKYIYFCIWKLHRFYANISDQSPIISEVEPHHHKLLYTFLIIKISKLIKHYIHSQKESTKMKPLTKLNFQ